MSFQFHGKEFTFTQPDGTKFEVRGWGDQHYATFETLDGHTVVRNASTGFWEIAERSEDGDTLVPSGAPAHDFDRAAHASSRGIRIGREDARARGQEVFRLMDGGWYRSDVKLYQKYHPPLKVQKQLESAGFTNIELSGFDWQAGLKPLTPEARRVFFLCKKPMR